MTTALVCAIILLAFVAATQWFMLANANEYVTSMEDFIVELDEGIDDVVHSCVMPSELRDELKEEAEDIRDSRKEVQE